MAWGPCLPYGVLPRGAPKFGKEVTRSGDMVKWMSGPEVIVQWQEKIGGTENVGGSQCFCCVYFR